MTTYAAWRSGREAGRGQVTLVQILVWPPELVTVSLGSFTSPCLGFLPYKLEINLELEGEKDSERPGESVGVMGVCVSFAGNDEFPGMYLYQNRSLHFVVPQCSCRIRSYLPTWSGGSDEIIHLEGLSMMLAPRVHHSFNTGFECSPVAGHYSRRWGDSTGLIQAPALEGPLSRRTDRCINR